MVRTEGVRPTAQDFSHKAGPLAHHAPSLHSSVSLLQAW